MRVWISAYTASLVMAASSMVQAASLELPGDTLPAGQQSIGFVTEFHEWQSSSDYVENASATNIDEQNQQPLREHGSRWRYQLSYLYGLTDNWSVGVSQSYAEQRWRLDQSEVYDDNSDGSMEASGAEDISLLVNYRLHEGVALALDLAIPSADASQAQPSGSSQEREEGGAASGVYKLVTEAGANWMSAQGTHWFGTLFAQIAAENRINNHDHAEPLGFGLEFGSQLNLKDHHDLNLSLRMERTLAYASYSNVLNTEVDYSDASSLQLKGQYLWAIAGSVQLRPYLHLSMQQPAIQKFNRSGTKERIESSGATETSVGLDFYLEL